VSDELRQGRIIWVELIDPQGRNPKPRPAVILTPTEQILPDGEVLVAAITSQTEMARVEVSVALPWHRSGHPKTKLDRRNAVVCTWLATIRVADIQRFGGHTSIPELNRIIEIVAHLQDGTGINAENPL